MHKFIDVKTNAAISNSNQDDVTGHRFIIPPETTENQTKDMKTRISQDNGHQAREDSDLIGTKTNEVDCMAHECFVLQKTANLFSRGSVPSYIPRCNVGEIQFFHNLTIIWWYHYYIF